MRFIRACSFLAAFFLAHATYAALITVPNFSFEEPDVVDGGTTDVLASIPGWTKVSSGPASAAVRDPLNAQYTGATGLSAGLPGTADGAQAALLGAGEGAATIRTNVGTVEANTRYLLTVAVGNPLDRTPGTVRLGLLTDGTLSASTTLLPASIPEGTFTDFSVGLGPFAANDAKIGSTLTIELAVSAGVPPTTPGAADFDNVRLTTVPEPAGAFALMLCVALGIQRRRSLYQPHRLS